MNEKKYGTMSKCAKIRISSQTPEIFSNPSKDYLKFVTLFCLLMFLFAFSCCFGNFSFLAFFFLFRHGFATKQIMQMILSVYCAF